MIPRILLALILAHFALAQSSTVSTSFSTFNLLTGTSIVATSTAVPITVPLGTNSNSNSNSNTANSNSTANITPNTGTSSATPTTFPVFSSTLNGGGGQGTGPAPAPGATQGGTTLGPGDGYTINAAGRGVSGVGWTLVGVVGAGVVLGGLV